MIEAKPSALGHFTWQPEALSKVGTMAQPVPEEARRADAIVIVAYVALGLAFVASFMPWATVFVFTVNGTSGDGVLTLVLALVGAAFLLGWHIGKAHSKGFLVSAIIATTLAAIVFWYDMINITRVAHAANSSGSLFHVSVTPGAGLYLGCLASTAAVVLEAVLLRRPALATRPPVASIDPIFPPAGWHPDPARRHDLRYFNGEAWTEHVSDGLTQAIDPLP